VLRPLLIVAISSQTLFAQSRPPRADTATTRRPTRPASQFCLGGHRIERCRSFAIVEIPIGVRLARSLRSETGGLGDAYFGLELGGMLNRDDVHAIGASVSGAFSAGESYVAINARSRTWFSKSYRDLSAGVVAMKSTRHLPAYGLTASASSAYSDLIGVWAKTDIGLIGGPPRVSVHAGVRLGSYASLSLIGLAAALLVLGGGIHEDT
jgi:hypothetical protein